MLEDAITKLKQIRATISRDPALKDMIDARDLVIAGYQPVFSAEALPTLTATDFLSFLLFKNNHHWTGLHRQGPQICKDMESLRAALLQLHNGSTPIEDRFDFALQSVNHLGKGILSAILHIMYSNEFGVWNRTSEAVLKLFNILPELDRGASPGKRYKAINEVLHALKDGTGADLWGLDALLWFATRDTDIVNTPDGGAEAIEASESELGESQKFGLEKYLHEFLRDNWDATELGKLWNLYSEAGEEDAGYKYSCGPIGQIDILARHKNGHDWLVVELKRDRSGDATVGQLLRYMGYIKHTIAENGNKVFGLIIALSLDAKLHYAVSSLQNVALHTYEVAFKLGPPTASGQKLPFNLLSLSELVSSE